MPYILIALMSPPEAAPAFGQLPPVYRFAEVARERGYDVVWTCSTAFASAVARANPGDAIRTYPTPTFMNSPRLMQPLFNLFLNADIPQRMLPQLDESSNHEWLFDSYVTVGFDAERFFFPAMETVLTALSDFRPDLMFTYGCPVGLTAAHISGVPLVTFDNLMRLRNEGGRSYRRMDETVQKAIDLYGPPGTEHIPLEDIVRNEHQFRILSTIKFLDRKPYADNEFFVGGFEMPLALRQLNRQALTPRIDLSTRTVFAYFGSASISFRLVREILPQVFEEVNRLCATPYDCYVASQHVEKPYSQGAVHFAPEYDMQHVLPHAAYVFSHAGLNTVTQAMSHGVPLIMVPGAIHERRHNARGVAAMNAGVVVEVEDFTVPILSSILLDQTQEAHLKQGALRVQQLIRESGGIRRAFEVMETSWLEPYDKSRLQVIAKNLQRTVGR